MEKSSHTIIIALVIVVTVVVVLLFFNCKASCPTTSEKFHYFDYIDGYPKPKAAHYTTTPEPWDACGPGHKSCFYPHKACVNINTDDCMFQGTCGPNDQCTNGKCCISGRPCLPNPLSPPYIPFKCGEF